MVLIILRFVMDVIIWNHSELTSADAECRHYWLKSRLEDMNTRREDLFGGDSSMMGINASGDDDDTMLPDLVYVPVQREVAELHALSLWGRLRRLMRRLTLLPPSIMETMMVLITNRIV